MGGGLDWEAHCRAHYDKLFSPFSERRSEDIDVEVIGMYTWPEEDNCIGYELGSGFAGRLPEYHGHTEHGIAFAPMFCPWCVNDVALSAMANRMTQ